MIIINFGISLTFFNIFLDFSQKSIFDVTSIFVKNCQDNQSKESLITLLPSLLSLMAVNEESMLQ